jgi:hypothetical protein
MSGAPRNSDKLNTLAIATIGVCASALVYVSVAMLQAFYANDSADVQTMADYGGQESTAQSLKSAQLGNITEYQMASAANPGSTYQVPIERAMEMVAAAAKNDASNLVPAIGPAVQPNAPAVPAPAAPTEPTAPAAPTTPAPAPAPGAAPAAGNGR